MKRILLFVMALCLSSAISYAQFGKLGKKLGGKAKSALTKKAQDATKKVEEAVKPESVSKELEEKVEQAAGVLEPYETHVSVHNNPEYDGAIGFKNPETLGIYKDACKTNWDYLTKYRSYDPENWRPSNLLEQNTLYYMYREKKAVEENDLEKMTGEIYTRLMWCLTQLAKFNDAGQLQIIKYNDFIKNEYNPWVKAFKEQVYNGAPSVSVDFKDEAKRDQYYTELYNSWNWYVDKASTAGPNLKAFYLNQVMGTRDLCILLKRVQGAPEKLQEFDQKLLTVYNTMPDEFKQKTPYLTEEQLVERQNKREEQWAKEKAEKQAKEEERLAAMTKPFPKSNMPELDAECLRIFKAKFPDQDVKRVAIENADWHIQRKNGVIELRLVRVWVDKLGSDGKRYMSDYSVCQYYQGGGKYGKTQYHGVGLTTYLIKQ